jgi:hypothetical protein
MKKPKFQSRGAVERTLYNPRGARQRGQPTPARAAREDLSQEIIIFSLTEKCVRVMWPIVLIALG